MFKNEQTQILLNISEALALKFLFISLSNERTRAPTFFFFAFQNPNNLKIVLQFLILSVISEIILNRIPSNSSFSLISTFHPGICQQMLKRTTVVTDRLKSCVMGKGSTHNFLVFTQLKLCGFHYSFPWPEQKSSLAQKTKSARYYLQSLSQAQINDLRSTRARSGSRLHHFLTSATCTSI